MDTAPKPEPIDPDDNMALARVQAQMQAGQAEAGRPAAWIGAGAAGEHTAAAAVATQVAGPPSGDVAIPAAPDDGFDAAHGDETPAPSTLLRSIVAVILGAALAIAATGLWAGQIDVSRLPVVGPALAALMPAASPLKVTVAGAVTQLPSGGRVLEVTGTITNPGRRVQPVPLLKASLTGPMGNVRRWTISSPVTQLQPGESAIFASTVAGFPKDARTLSVTPGR